MTARILIVDHNIAQLKQMESRLAQEYFTVLTCTQLSDAKSVCDEGLCDVVLLDSRMQENDMKALDLCKTIKDNPKTYHLPVVMITSQNHPTERIRGLEAGADDFLTRPVDELALLSRTRNLARVKMLVDELRVRADSVVEAGFSAGLMNEIDQFVQNDKRRGKILLVENDENVIGEVVSSLMDEHDIEIERNPENIPHLLKSNSFDLLVISLTLQQFDSLRIVSQVRSIINGRNVPVLMCSDAIHDDRLLRALELGVNDYILAPIDPSELRARVKTQIKRHYYTERLRKIVSTSIQMALTDPLTGTYNRRYMENHLPQLVNKCLERNQSLTLMLLDIDHFKSINDSFGHDAGDKVLVEFANRIKQSLRGSDLVCRYGGEEFVIAMPGSSKIVAMRVAERLRRSICDLPINISTSKTAAILVTVSIGVSAMQGEADTPDLLLRRADRALYVAKQEGRNRVVADAA